MFLFIFGTPFKLVRKQSTDLFYKIITDEQFFLLSYVFLFIDLIFQYLFYIKIITSTQLFGRLLYLLQISIFILKLKEVPYDKHNDIVIFRFLKTIVTF